MLTLREIEERVLANGKVEGTELEALRKNLYADGKIDRKDANFLVELHKRAQYRTNAFQQFFYKAIKDHILANGRITASKTAWLRQILCDNGKIEDEERRFLHQLKGEAREVSPEFQALFQEVMKLPAEQRTSG